ncbi:MAG TPA: two-component sensor histidine kinase [Syntrophobacteraceae bacterium]|nr:two-component sensor histidine kinase [Syntrophobacteraceae bacterium]
MEERGIRKLRWKIIATTLGFSLIPLFVLGFTIYYQFSVSYTAKIMDSMRTLVENRRNAIDLFLDERVSQLYVLANTESIHQLSDGEYLHQVFSLVQSRSKSFVDLGIIDQDGNHVAYSGPYQLKGVNYRNEEWFHEVMLRGVYISDVFMGFRKFPHFIIAVMRREGDRRWIMRATIDTNIFDALVKEAQVGEKGDAFVINKGRILQTTPRFGGELLATVEGFNYSSFSGSRIEERELKGQNMLVAVTWIRNKDWLLVIKQDPRVELMPLFHARHMVIWVALGGLLLITAGTVFVVNEMMEALIKADREKAALDAGLMQSSKMAALGKMAAGIAHEVNNPLAVIKEKVGWLKDLLSEEDVSASENFAEFKDALNKIEHHVERAKKVTHRLLGFARRMEPTEEKVDVNKVLSDTTSFLENDARYKNISITTDYAPNLPPTLSDASQIQQVFLNILNNAIDAIGKDGEVRITTSSSPKEKEIAISISDNGPGMPNDVLNRIFDPFFTTKEVGHGTGLGLSISYSIIEKLGGRIMVASEVSKGTTFTIYLPIRGDASGWQLKKDMVP